MDTDDRISVIRDDLTAAAQSSAETARELAKLANGLLPKISRDDPMDTQDVLQSIAVLSKMVNETSALARAVLQQPGKRQPVSAQPPDLQGAGFAELDRAVSGLVANLSERRAARRKRE